MIRRDSHVAPEVKVQRPLLVWHPSTGGRQEYEVWPERPMTIGRDATNAVVVESPFVSKTHAIIRYAGGEFTIEDLKSANGTRVNGAPVLVSVLVPGDVVEVGDQRFEFVEGSQAAEPKARGGLSKNTKLAMAAIGTMGVTGMLMAMLVSSGSPAPEAAVRSGRPKGAAKTTGAAEGPLPAVNANSVAVRETLEHARQAGIQPADALFDDANQMLQSGRLREATEMFAAVVERDPKHEAAVRRLKETRAAWAEAIADHAAEGERAADELRLNDAILEWGQVLLLTDVSDPRHATAEQGIADARRRLAR